MLSDEIKKRMIQAMKDKQDLEKQILRVALGEIQTVESRTGKKASDEEAAALVRKLVKSNEESLAASEDEEQKQRLARENEVLKDLLPKTMDEGEIVDALEPVAEAIRAAGNDGQATGLAMKHLKAAGAAVTGKDVAHAVRKMRS
ncbi:MAG: GatB/YqeY domain-containing protein [Planctomycetota bacterium]|jgi:uncharacterized protein YqeY